MRLNRIAARPPPWSSSPWSSRSVCSPGSSCPARSPTWCCSTVLGLALVYGHVGGALVGFCAGLLSDFAPPADHAAGAVRAGALRRRLPRGARPSPTTENSARHRTARRGRQRRRSARRCCTRASARSSGTTRPAMWAFVGLLITATVYDLLLAPFTVPLVMALARRTGARPAGSGRRPAAPAAEGAYGLAGLQKRHQVQPALRSHRHPERGRPPGSAARAAPCSTAADGTRRRGSRGVKRLMTRLTSRPGDPTEGGKHVSNIPETGRTPRVTDPAGGDPGARLLAPAHPRRTSLVPPGPQRRRVHDGGRRTMCSRS